jgi:hypothetical protein
MNAAEGKDLAPENPEEVGDVGTEPQAPDDDDEDDDDDARGLGAARGRMRDSGKAYAGSGITGPAFQRAGQFIQIFNILSIVRGEPPAPEPPCLLESSPLPPPPPCCLCCCCCCCSSSSSSSAFSLPSSSSCSGSELLLLRHELRALRYILCVSLPAGQAGNFQL